MLSSEAQTKHSQIYVAILSILLALYCFRALAQLLQFYIEVTFLPPFDAWQMGETSLLTRAALIVVQAARDIVIAQEGAFGTMLLESDAVQPTLMFGAKGALDMKAFGLEHLPALGSRRSRTSSGISNTPPSGPYQLIR